MPDLIRFNSNNARHFHPYMQLHTGVGIRQLNSPVTKMMARLSAAAAAAAPGPVVGSSVVTADVAEPYTTARGTGQQVYSGWGG
jgi:hypothetical protein